MICDIFVWCNWIMLNFTVLFATLVLCIFWSVNALGTWLTQMDKPHSLVLESAKKFWIRIWIKTLLNSNKDVWVLKCFHLHSHTELSSPTTEPKTDSYSIFKSHFTQTQKLTQKWNNQSIANSHNSQQWTKKPNSFRALPRTTFT